jgi:CheY-like chemotaxis protein
LFLMLKQGTLSFAVPWHAVIRIRLTRPDDVDATARREGCPVLAPWVTVPRPESERPVVLVGLGLRRALLLADRLVWRMPADPIESDAAAPGPELGQAVRTADGDTFWVVDPARLLSGVEPPRTPEISARPPAPPRPAAPPPAPPAPPTARPASEPRLGVLRREDVEPLPQVVAEEPPALPAAPSVAGAPVVRGAEPPPARRARRRALVAEDSIVGRMFLQRLLSPRGFAVEAVTSARELERALKRGGWDMVLVDVSLPDSPRGRHLGALSPEGLVALARDREDERIAAEAGIRQTLRKPFDRADLLRVVRALGFSEEAS